MKFKFICFAILAGLALNQCADPKPYSDDQAQLAIPDAGDLPETELTEAERAKMATAKGKSVEAMDFESFEQLIEKNKEDVLYIYNFWATWCKPCVEEMPYFEKLQNEFEGQVKVIFVSLDNPTLLEKRVIPFVREKQIKAEVILLTESLKEEYMNRISLAWEGGSIPATLVVNHTKDMRFFYEQEFTFEELKVVISPLLL